MSVNSASNAVSVSFPNDTATKFADFCQFCFHSVIAELESSVGTPSVNKKTIESLVYAGALDELIGDVEIETSRRVELNILEKENLQNLVLVPFTKEFSHLSATEFVEKILVGNLKAKKVVIGYDHQFGRNREGNIQFLKSVSEKYGFEVIEISAKSIDEINISSTKVRDSLLRGDVETAKLFLSRPYEISGTVVKGNQLGRTIGFPTANIQLDHAQKLIPKVGIYAVEVVLNPQETYFGMLYIGFRNGLDGLEKRIEVNIFDFDREIYGEEVQIFMHAFIRDDQDVKSLTDLIPLLQNDKKNVVEFFAKQNFVA